MSLPFLLPSLRTTTSSSHLHSINSIAAGGGQRSRAKQRLDRQRGVFSRKMLSAELFNLQNSGEDVRFEWSLGAIFFTFFPLPTLFIVFLSF